MTYKYFPHTPEDLQAMLEACGLSSLDQLSADVPSAIRFTGDYDLPSSMSELEIRRVFDKLAARNKRRGS